MALGGRGYPVQLVAVGWSLNLTNQFYTHILLDGNYRRFYLLASNIIKYPHKIAAKKARPVTTTPPIISQFILFVAIASLPTRIGNMMWFSHQPSDEAPST